MPIPLPLTLTDLDAALQGAAEARGLVRGAAFVFCREPRTVIPLPVSDGTLLPGVICDLGALRARLAPRLASVTTPRRLYAPGDLVHLLVAAPGAHDLAMTLRLRLQGSLWDTRALTLDRFGCAHALLAGLPEGAWEATLEAPGIDADPCAFEIAVYALARLTATLEERVLRDSALHVQVRLRAFGAEIPADEVDLALRAGPHVKATLRAKVEDGLVHAALPLGGDDDLALDLKLASDPAATATVTLEGSRASEVQETPLSLYGTATFASAAPRPGSREVRSLHLRDAPAPTRPFTLDLSTPHQPTLISSSDIQQLHVIAWDTARRTLAAHVTREAIAPGESLQLALPRSVAHLLLIGAFVDGAPWEGWALALQPGDLPGVRIEAPSTAPPGHPLQIALRAATGDAAAFVVVRDARLPPATTPAGRLAGALKRWIDDLHRDLHRGPCDQPLPLELGAVRAALMAPPDDAASFTDLARRATTLAQHLADLTHLTHTPPARWQPGDLPRPWLQPLGWTPDATTALALAPLQRRLEDHLDLLAARITTHLLQLDPETLRDDQQALADALMGLYLATAAPAHHDATPADDDTLRTLSAHLAQLHPTGWKNLQEHALQTNPHVALHHIAQAIAQPLNDLIARAEDPEKLLSQLLLDLQQLLLIGKKHTVTAITDEKRAARQRDAHLAEADEWERKAMLAVRANNDDLAREALTRRRDTLLLVQPLQTRHEALRAWSERLKNALRALNAKIDEARRKRNLLIARSKRAMAQRTIQETMHSLQDGSSFDAFARMEAEAQAPSELAAESTGAPLPASTTPSLPPTERPPDLLFAGLLTLRDGLATATLNAPDEPAELIVEAFVLSGLDWTTARASLTIAQDPWLHLDLPPFLDPRDHTLGRLTLYTRHRAPHLILTRDAQSVPIELRKESDHIFSATFPVHPGRWTATLITTASAPPLRVTRAVAELGDGLTTEDAVVFLQPGQALRLADHPHLFAIAPLADVSALLDPMTRATASYEHLCCEQTAAKMLATAALLATAPPGSARAAEDEAALLAGVRRMESMWIKGRGLRLYPTSTEPNAYWGATAARHLMQLSALRDLPAASPDLTAASTRCVDIALDVLHAHNTPWPPTNPDHLPDALWITRHSQHPDLRRRAAERARALAANLPDDAGSHVASRADLATAAAILLDSDDANDLPNALRLGQLALQALEPRGRLYSTVDSVAAIAFLGALHRRGILNTPDADTTGDPTHTITARSRPVIARTSRLRPIKPWERPATARLGARLLRGDTDTTRAAEGDTIALVATLDRYLPGDLLWCCLPHALARIEGGGQLKLFSLDLQGARTATLHLAALRATTAADGSPAPHHLRLWLRNMFDDRRCADAGDLALTVLPRGSLPPPAQNAPLIAPTSAFDRLSTPDTTSAFDAFERMEARINAMEQEANEAADEALNELKRRLGLTPQTPPTNDPDPQDP